MNTSGQALRSLSFGVAAALLLAASPVRAAAPAPAADLNESFAVDPRTAGNWTFSGPLTWDSLGRTMVSATSAAATAVWAPGRYYAGTFSARVKLVSGRPGAPVKASLIFALDPATGANRWVSLTAGAPGTLVLGQSGTIRGSAARTIKTAHPNLPRNTWLKLTLAIDGAGKATVTLGATKLFTVAAGPLAPGAVGFSAARSKVAFGALTFTGNPDAEPCAECHAGQGGQPLAPNVYAFWDGSWWNATQGGSPTAQHGGHGDPGGQPASTCAGATGCHDLRQPVPDTHRNGVLEGVGAPSANTFHLRTGFVNAAPAAAPDVALAFDGFCYTACHQAARVADMRMVPASRTILYTQLGLKGTDPTGGGIPAGFPLDQDITAAAGSGEPLFAVCVTCHDPHGTGTVDQTFGSNHMLRLPWLERGTLCRICHR
jgi:cytochrome c553